MGGVAQCGSIKMRGIYLSYVTSSNGQRKLVPRLEDHVCMWEAIQSPVLGVVWLSALQVILPPLGEGDVMVQIKACALSRIDTKVRDVCICPDQRAGNSMPHGEAEIYDLNFSKCARPGGVEFWSHLLLWPRQAIQEIELPMNMGF